MNRWWKNICKNYRKICLKWVMEGLQDCASAINKTYQKLSRSMNRALRISEEILKFSEKERHFGVSPGYVSRYSNPAMPVYIMGHRGIINLAFFRVEWSQDLCVQPVEIWARVPASQEVFNPIECPEPTCPKCSQRMDLGTSLQSKFFFFLLNKPIKGWILTQTGHGN